MSTLISLKILALRNENEYVKKCVRVIEKYLDTHKTNKIVSLIEDDDVLVYDGNILLLRINTTSLIEGVIA